MSYSNKFLINKYQQNLATYIFSFIVVMAFYSFGTFGLLNLYGLRSSFQFLGILFVFFGLISIVANVKSNKEYKNKNIILLVIILFFLYYGLMFVLIKGEIVNTLVQSLLMMIFVLYLMFVNIKFIHIISKLVVVFTFVFSIMGFIAYLAFLFNDSLISEIDFGLYGSTIGSETIYAKSWIEYLSFSSGDGFEFFGSNVIRVKGFCNEPSATIVHYLAPVGLAFLYSKKYKVMGVFILSFNFIAIASMIGWLIIFGSVIIYFILSIKNKLLKKIIIYIGVLSIIFLMLNIDYTVSLIVNSGENLYEATSSSLLARKEGSATTRLLSFATAVDEFKSYPFGGSHYNTMTGLILNISLVGGIFIFLVSLIFSLSLIKNGIEKFKNSNQKSIKLGVSFILTTLLVALVLSGYGWDRIPGVIMLILFYRHVKEEELVDYIHLLKHENFQQ